MKSIVVVFFAVLAGASLSAQEGGAGPSDQDNRDLLIRERYEQVLQRDPLQDAAFDRVYESYMLTEGADAWLGKLKAADGQAETVGNLVLRGRILARQFKTRDAVQTLSRARDLGESSPAFNALLGRLYYETGNDQDAIVLLGAALDATESPEKRSEICRMLGSVYLRSGKRSEAAAVWERLAELNPNDLFALQELAEIYEENRLWDEAIAARKRIIAAASSDPYRQCHAWRAIGQSCLAKEEPGEAIAAFEQGLALAAPGNWLFEDLKGRLVAVYESRGDLEGLSAYLDARIAQDPADLSLAELRADVALRRDDFTKAEALLKDVVARAPGRASALEMLITLYTRTGRMEDVAATYETLIAQYPAEPDYLRRLGEAWLAQKETEKALETWRRILGDGKQAGMHAQLAEWLERSEFFPEAAAAYEAALALQPNREWRLRLASLQYDMGEEEAALAAWQAAVAPEDTPAGEVAEIATILLSKAFKAEAEALYVRVMALEPENLDHVLAYARILAGREDFTGAAAQYTRLAEQGTSEYIRGEGERGLLDAYEALGTLDQQRLAWEDAIRQAPADTAARLKLARLYARLGNRPGVVKLYEECAATDPARVEFERLLASAYKENRQTEKAIETIERLMEKDGERAQAYLRDLLALYGASGRPQEAIRAAEKLVELSPSSPEARTALAQVYLRNGEPEKGLQQYRNLVQLDATQPAYFREFGDALQQFGSLGEAQDAYRKMLDVAADDSTRLDAVNRLAAVYVRNGQRDVLLEEFKRRVSAAPRSLAAYQELAAVFRAAGDMRGALETLEQARGEVEDRDAVLRLIMAEAFQAGDHQKVLAIHEELLARAAEPTPQDLDKLAGAYAQVGRMDEAIEIWTRIARENSEDAAMQLQVARQLETYGYFDEAQGYTERALEIDPYNYDLRFEFAQQLLALNEVDRAQDQLKKLLDIGDRPAAPTATGSATAPAAQNTSPAAPFQGGMAMNMNFGMPNRMRVGFGGSRRYGQSFSDVRQQAVQALVQLSRQVDGAEPVVDTYRKRIEAQPENVDLRRDYLLVCEAAEQPELALEAARELSALQPDDVSLRWRIFGYLQQLGRTEEAITIAKELSGQSDMNLANQARLMHVRLLAESQRYAEAEAVLAEVADSAPEKAQIYLQVATSFQNAENQGIADQLYQKAAELDPNFLGAALAGRARLCQERGDTTGARDLFVEAMFIPAVTPPANMPQRPRNFPSPIYVPQGMRGGRQSMNNIAMLPGYNLPVMDHQRAQALNQAYRLMATPEEFAPVLERLRAAADGYVAADSDEARAEAANFVYMYIASLRNTDRASDAIQALEAMLLKRPGDFLLQNLRLTLLEEQARFDEMMVAYDDLAASNPTLAGEVARARLQLALTREDIAAIPALYRALPDTVMGGPVRGGMQGMRTGQLGQVVRILDNAGAREEARALLEEELARSRDAGILVQLSRLCVAERRFDEAIGYAREAYEKQGPARSRGQNYQYSMNAMSLQMQGLYGLETLWNAYREAGREAELIADFESRLKGQPTSVTLRQSLIGLYMESRQYDRARAQMEKLMELRPNDAQLKVRYAGLLESNNDPAGALAVLESVVASRPSANRGVSREIQRLYKDLGKTEELAELQERMKREARSANELQELAQQLGQEKEYVQAAELLERALRLEPQNTWLVFQIGDYYWQAGNKDRAVSEYLKLFQSTSPQGGIQVDSGRTPEIIARAAEAGRLEELKAIAAGTHTDAYVQRSLSILRALIARHEGRAEEAEQILKEIARGNSDHYIISLLSELAEARGDLPAAIQYVESAGKVAGQVDFQRLARLYLRAGDLEKTIQAWKKFAAQHGGEYGHTQAIEALAETGAHDMLRTYVHDVLATLPATDPAREPIAQILFRVNNGGTRYDELIDREIFSVETKDMAELARRYVSDLDNVPGLARRRIEPIAARFPQNKAMQAVYAEVLEKLGDEAGAIAILKSFAGDSEFYERYGDRLSGLLRQSGDLDAWREFALERARRANPTERDVAEASEALVASGRRGELAALREQVLSASEPGQQVRLKAGFAEFDANRGDITGARVALKTLMEESGDAVVRVKYFQHLIEHGYHTEAGLLYASWPEDLRESVFEAVRARGILSALMATGDTEAAWKEVMRRVLRHEAGRDPSGHQLASELRALADFCNYAVPAPVMDSYFASIRSQAVLSKSDRFALAWWAINQGHWPAALEMIGEYRDEQMFRDLIDLSKELVPRDMREELLKRPDEDPASQQPAASSEPEVAPAPPKDSPREQIERARDLAGNGKPQEAVALLDTLAISSTDADLLERRASTYREADAPEKSATDLTALLVLRPDRRDLRVNLAECLALSGKTAEAMAAWREAGHPTSLEFARLLFEKALFAEVLEVLDGSGVAGNRAVEFATLRGRTLAGMGQIDEMVLALESAYQDLDGSGRSELVSQLASEWGQSGVWQAVLGRDSLKANALVNHVLLELLDRVEPALVPAVRNALIERVNPESLIQGGDVERFSRLLIDAGQRDRAIAVLTTSAKAPGKSPRSIRRLVNALNNMEATREATELVIALSTRNPAFVADDPAYAIERAEDLQDGDARDALFDRVIELAPTDALANFAAALKTWYGPDQDAARAAMTALAESPGVQAPELLRAANLLTARGEETLAVKALERLASGDFGDAAQDDALIKLAALRWKAQDVGAALDVMLRLQPALLQVRAEVWWEAFTFLGKMPWETVEPLLLAQIQSDPARRGVEDIVALRGALAASHGLPVPSLDFANLGLTPDREATLRLFGGLITNWVTSSVDTRNTEAIFSHPGEELAALLRGEDISLSAAREWSPLVRGDAYPFVLSSGNSSGRAPWGVSEYVVKIESPDARSLTLAVGSSDQIRIWVNETEVYLNRFSRLNCPDTDRCEVVLKPGVNWVFVRANVTPQSTAGSFSLSILTGGEGLRVLTPPLPDQAVPQAGAAQPQ